MIFITRKLLRIPNLIETLQRPVKDTRVEAMAESMLRRAFLDLDCDLIERYVDWVGEDDDFSKVCTKLQDVTSSGSKTGSTSLS